MSNLSSVLGSRTWVVGRRVVLVVIVLIVGYRSYGDALSGWLRGPDPGSDIVVTRSELRTDLGGDRPMWFIGLRNTSARTTYDRIEMEATYFDGDGQVIETDRIVVDQRIAPGEQQDIGSPDVARREGAVRGTLRVIDARMVE